jgi:nucleoside-diphosphate-sugar epimerase
VGAEIVIHTAVSYGKYAQQQQTNVEGTAALARASHEAGVSRFVHISSLAAYGYGHTAPISEDTAPTPSNEPYALTKRAGERAMQSVENLSWAIVRPGAIYGQNSNLWTKTMFKLANRRPFVFLGNGRGRVPLVHVDDVVDLCLVVAQHPHAHQQAFHIAHPTIVTWRDFLTGYARLAGKELRWLGLPVTPVSAFTWLAKQIAPKPSNAAALHELLGYLQTTPIYDLKKSKELLGWQPQVDLATGMARCIPYLRSLGLLP